MTSEARSSPSIPVSGRRPLRWSAVLSLNLSAAAASLRGNFFRTGLTILGVVIGVAAVIVLVAFGEGARTKITGQIDTLGANVAIVVPGKITGQVNFNPTGGLGLSNLGQADVDAVRRVDGVRRAAPVTLINGSVFRAEKPASICLPVATTPDFIQVRRLGISEGRFFTEEEMSRPVCVLGTGVRKDLFGEEKVLGEEIEINGEPYRVVGVVRERSIGSGLFGGEELDAIIYLPQGVIHERMKSRQIHRILVEVEPQREPQQVLDAVKATLLEARAGRDDFSLLSSKDLLDMFYKVFTLLATLLLGITSISLIVGGIGIMNVMLVTVTERTREIGIRKTVGARRQDIFYQFLTEAVTLSLLGGIGGIALALAACAVIAGLQPLKPVVTLWAVLLGFGVCVAVGVISGVLPAVVASRKDPIAAIRHE